MGKNFFEYEDEHRMFDAGEWKLFNGLVEQGKNFKAEGNYEWAIARFESAIRLAEGTIVNVEKLEQEIESCQRLMHTQNQGREM